MGSPADDRRQLTGTWPDLTAEERADAVQVVRLLGTLALTASAKPGGDVEIHLLRSCAALIGDLSIVDSFSCDCLGTLVYHLIQRQDVDEAVALARREIELRREIGDPAPLAQALGRQARALESAELLDEALEVLTEAFSAARQAHLPDLAVTVLLDRARILGTRAGRFEEALRVLQEAHDLSDFDSRERVREQTEAALSWILQSAEAAEDAGETDTAIRHYVLVEATAQTADMPAVASRALCNHARVLGAILRQPDRALPLAERGLALAREHELQDQERYATELIRAIRRDLKSR